jgi:hypothetical protein
MTSAWQSQIPFFDSSTETSNMTTYNCRRLMKLFITCLICTISSSFAQPVSQRQIGLGMGWSYVAIKTPTTSPLTYQNSTAPFQIFFNNGGAKNRHFVQVLYQTGTLKNSVGNSITEIRGGVQYSYHRRITALKNGITLYGGAVFNGQASIRQGTGTNSEDGNSFLALDASFLAIYNKNKNTFEGQLSSTLLAYTMSPEYSLSPPPGASDPLLKGESPVSQAMKFGKWSGPGSFYQFTLRLSYERSLSNRFSVRGDCRWNFYKFRNDPVFGSVSNQLIASLVYKFMP